MGNYFIELRRRIKNLQKAFARNRQISVTQNFSNFLNSTKDTLLNLLLLVLKYQVFNRWQLETHHGGAASELLSWYRSTMCDVIVSKKITDSKSIDEDLLLTLLNHSLRTLIALKGVLWYDIWIPEPFVLPIFHCCQSDGVGWEFVRVWLRVDCMQKVHVPKTLQVRIPDQETLLKLARESSTELTWPK